LSKRTLTLIALFVSLIFFSGCQYGHGINNGEKKETSLKNLAKKKHIYIGTAVRDYAIKRDPNYSKLIAHEFNSITPENEMKFSVVHPGKYYYNFSDADNLVDYAKLNNLVVRGHTLVWDKRIPAWLQNGNFTKDEMEQILKGHIETVVGHFKGKVYAWDVVNEAFNGDGSLKDSIWLRTIGPEYIQLAFQWAHEADTKALLFYNDYSIETVNSKSNAVYNMVKDFKRKGIQIDGVGFQTHTGIYSGLNLESMEQNMDRFGKINVKVNITELDIGILGNEPIRARQKKQAQMYGNIMKTCLKSSACSSFTMWGVTDKYTWRPDNDAPLIFDKNFRKKEAYWSLFKNLNSW